VDDGVHRFLDRAADLLRTDRDRLRKTGYEVASLDLGDQLVWRGEYRCDRQLYRFGGALAEQERVLLLDVLDDRLVELVSSDADARRGDDAAERDHCDLGRPAADVDDHVPRRLVD